jgi:hypothetical protein
MFEPETKRAASVVQIVFGRAEAACWPAQKSGWSRRCQRGRANWHGSEYKHPARARPGADGQVEGRREG